VGALGDDCEAEAAERSDVVKRCSSRASKEKLNQGIAWVRDLEGRRSSDRGKQGIAEVDRTLEIENHENHAKGTCRVESGNRKAGIV
jgi:hypothetical protein